MANAEKKKSKSRFGEILLECGVITQEQLTKALRRQIQAGGYIGSILEEMGYLDEDSLLNFLSKQLNTSSLNLFETKIEPDILNLLPFNKIKTFMVLPVKEVDGKVSLAMTNPNDIEAIQDIEFALGRQIEPVVVPFFQMERALAFFEKKGYGNRTFEGELLRKRISVLETRVPSLLTLLRFVLDYKATDLHISAGVPPSVRVDNDMQRLSLPAMTPEHLKEIQKTSKKHLKGTRRLISPFQFLM